MFHVVSGFHLIMWFHNSCEMTFWISSKPENITQKQMKPQQLWKIIRGSLDLGLRVVRI